MNEDELMAALQVRVKSEIQRNVPRPVVTEQEWAAFELEVGQDLPPLFRRLYQELGDGGWGPHAGLCPLGVRGDEDEPHFSVLGLWSGLPNEEHLLYFCNGGCVTFSVLDLATGQVGLRDADDPIVWQTTTLHEWLERWLRGEHVMAFPNTP